MDNDNRHYIGHSEPIRNALMKLNEVPDNLTLFVLDDQQKMVGSVTDGDIRRGLLAGKTTDASVSEFMYTHFRFLRKGKFSLEEVEEIRRRKIKLLPMLDENDHIVRLIDFNKVKSILPTEVVIMAGGRGERLRPLTDTTPKSLLPVGGKPILEINIDRLSTFGLDNIFITVKYLHEQIMNYFGDGADRGIQIHYVLEDKPMGTIGSVSRIKGLEHEHILLMNADLLTNIDFEDFFKKYLEENADMAVASIPYQVDLPYAVLETHEGNIKSFREKPTYTYYSNAGIYLIRRELLEMIPVEQHFNATDFMQLLLEQKKKLIYYPILGYWLDIGRHEDYTKANEDIKHFQL